MDLENNRRARLIALAVVGIGSIGVNGLTGSIAVDAATLGKPPSGGKVLHAALAAAEGVGSVRVTVHFFSGKTAGLLIEDSGRASGKQTVAIGKERVSIVLVHGTVYFSGNNAGLVNYFGLTRALASTLSNRWISASPTDPSYASLTAGLTLSSALKEVTPTGRVTRGHSRTIRGESTTSVSGTGPAGLAEVSLFIARKGRPLPLEAVGSDRTKTGTSGEIVDFSRWGEVLHVPQPTDAIPISSFSAGSSTGG